MDRFQAIYEINERIKSTGFSPLLKTKRTWIKHKIRKLLSGKHQKSETKQEKEAPAVMGAPYDYSKRPPATNPAWQGEVSEQQRQQQPVQVLPTGVEGVTLRKTGYVH